MVNANDKSASITDSPPILSLDRKYVYQTPTGTISSTSLTVRQLCRVFSPPSSSINSSTAAGDNDDDVGMVLPPPPSRFSTETQLIALLPDGVTYDPTGWKPARDIFILRHAASIFYYCFTKTTTTGATTTTTTNDDDDESDNGTTRGPVSCRQLAQVLTNVENENNNNNNSVDNRKSLQVYGTSTNNAWVSIDAVPDLPLAIEAFRQQYATVGIGLSHKNEDAITATNTTANVNTNTDANEYDVSVMVYENDEKDTLETRNSSTQVNMLPTKEVQDELEAFLSSTDGMGPKKMGGAHHHLNSNSDDEDDDDEAYISDGGTKYGRDPRTGNWVHHSLLQQEQTKKKKKKEQPISNQEPPNKKMKTQDRSNSTNNNSNDNNSTNIKKESKKTKTKFKAKNAKNWIYITGLPPDATEDEVARFCSKVGILDLDPETQRPKVKLYRYKEDTLNNDKHDVDQSSTIISAGTCKGDASVGYARPESVELALQVLDEAPFRDDALIGNNKGNPYKLRVQRAKFEQHGTYTQQRDKLKRISQAQRKVARLAARQAVDRDEGEFNGRLTGGLKGLRITVLKNMFRPHELLLAAAAADSSSSVDGGDETNKNNDDIDDKNQQLLAELEEKVRTSCSKHGNVEKITVFSKNPRGVVVVKFSQPGAASEAVKAWDGQLFALVKEERKVEATFWDGAEDFTVRNETKEAEEMEQRHDAFGAWLEKQAEDELPEELRLKVEEA